MKTKSIITLVVMLCVSVLTVAKAGLDYPLKHKIPSWKYVVIIQAGKHYGEKKWQIERNIIEVLRGDKNELPSFDQWMSPEFQKQDKYYLAIMHLTNQGDKTGEKKLAKSPTICAVVSCGRVP